MPSRSVKSHPSREDEPLRNPLAAVREERVPVPISVALAERPALVREAVSLALVHAGLHVTASCETVDELVELVRRRRPNVVLLNAALDEGDDDGLATVRRLRDAGPASRLVVLAHRLTPAVSRAALAREVDGLVTGAMSPRAVAATLRQVAAGQAVFPAGWIAAAHQADEQSLDAMLSPRQFEVLELIARGLTNREIADRLHLSSNTVKFHVRTVYERTGVVNRVQAAQVLASARRRGPPG